MSTVPPGPRIDGREPATRRAGWPAALRVVAALYALGVFAQALFAGQFLSGQGQWLTWHDLNGTAVLTWLLVIQLVLAILVWRPGRGRAWPALVTIVQLLAAWLQIETGYSTVLAVHIPLGVALFGLAVGLTLALGRLTR